MQNVRRIEGMCKDKAKPNHKLPRGLSRCKFECQEAYVLVYHEKLLILSKKKLRPKSGGEGVLIAMLDLVIFADSPSRVQTSFTNTDIS